MLLRFCATVTAFSARRAITLLVASNEKYQTPLRADAQPGSQKARAKQAPKMPYMAAAYAYAQALDVSLLRAAARKAAAGWFARMEKWRTPCSMESACLSFHRTATAIYEWRQSGGCSARLRRAKIINKMKESLYSKLNEM